MRDSDATPIFLGVAALAVALWLHLKNTDSESAMKQCHSDFQSFKEGVLYGR